MDVADADDGRIQRRHVAPDDTLQAQHEMRLGIGDIGRKVRLRAAMAADATESHGPGIGRGQHRADAGAEGRGRHTRRVVQPVDGVAGETLEQPVLQHRDGAAASLFGRLEDQHHRPAEVGIGGEIAGGSQQHGGVPVMTAGVHLAGIGRGVGDARLLFQRQAIHVGTQADRALPGPLAADDADHARAEIDA